MMNPKDRIQYIDHCLAEDGKILFECEEREKLLEEKRRLLAYRKGLLHILRRNPYLEERVGCGYHDFRDFACGRQFYVDKTHFITEWLQSDAKVTLITRPRRFGKTMLLSTVETFFDMYEAHDYLRRSSRLSENDKAEYEKLRTSFFDGYTDYMETAVQKLCYFFI